ncbi:hypothetical protein [Saccharothrix australiensis]|uniref:hypothetical protein n=1 Tax=Saccharothrix australiensis TaxID=2072 RepID=UPI0011C41C17|nr:hypothetical protein [Saccharothrix australiensis]
MGDSVVVEWGLDEVVGEIRNVYESGGVVRVLVAVELPDSGPETVVLPLDSVRLIDDQPIKEPGHWRNQAALLRGIAKRLANVDNLDELHVSPRLADGREADLVLKGRDGRSVVVEVKSLRNPSQQIARSAIYALRQYMRSAGEDSRGIALFLIEDGQEGALKFLEEIEDPRISIVFWRNAKDGQRLMDAVVRQLGGGDSNVV